MNNKLYVSDLDGTFIRNDKSLSEFSRSSIINLLNKGLHFTIASARSVFTIREILGAIPFRLPIIEFNGAYISDWDTGKHHVINAMSRDLIGELYSNLQKFQLSPFMSAFDGSVDHMYYAQASNDGALWYLEERQKANDRRLKEVIQFRDHFNEQIVTITVIERKDRLSDFVSYLSKNFSERIEYVFYENMYSPGWYWLTINDRRASKDQALKKLLEIGDFKQEELVVFGDQINDIKMFQFAPRSIAVNNAEPELKQYATEIIGSNEEDSVIRYILKDLNHHV